jgi:hypothetical protein
VLRHFHKRTSAARLVQACRHTKRHGTFAIALAVALREHGLSVEFNSEPDPAPHSIEKRCYRVAAELGIRMAEPPELETMLASASSGCIPIVLFNTDKDNGHFSPVAGTDGDCVLLPYADQKRMPKAELQQRRSAPGIYRQCVIVHVGGTTPQHPLHLAAPDH